MYAPWDLLAFLNGIRLVLVIVGCSRQAGQCLCCLGQPPQYVPLMIPLGGVNPKGLCVAPSKHPCTSHLVLWQATHHIVPVHTRTVDTWLQQPAEQQ